MNKYIYIFSISLFCIGKINGNQLLLISTRISEQSVDLFSEVCLDQNSKISMLEPIDTTAPYITKVRADSNTLQLFFNEEIEFISVTDPENYVLSNLAGQTQMPWQVKINSPSSVVLYFGKLWTTHSYSLICKKLSDSNENSVFNYIYPFDYGTKQNLIPFQLLVTEIMADPSPPVSLPNFEYIEIYNPGTQIINLTDVQLQFESTNYSMDTSTLLIHPGAYLILCEKNAYEEFKNFGRVHKLNKWPAIRNTMGSISLVQNEKIIHSVHYEDSWYKDNLKKNGGWSLEMINSSNVCDRHLNWLASRSSSGGTPGKKNSVADSLYVIAPNNDSLIVFDDNKLKFKVNKSIGPLDAGSIQIEPILSFHIIQNNSYSGEAEIQFDSPIQRGIVYQLKLNIKDCDGKLLTSLPATSFIKKENIDYQDLIINEILFNPPAFGSDYVEIYNKSNKIIPLAGCTLSNENNGQKRKINADRWIFPGEFIVFCADSAYISDRYKFVKNNWIVVQTLPALSDESGQLTLYSPIGMVIDSMHYNENYHSSFLSTTEGVSLERVNVNSSTSSSDWHSASGLDYYGTPTRANSIKSGLTQPSNFQLKRKIFSPNQDGYEDHLEINYSLPGKDYLSRIYIYDDHGRLIKKLAENVILSAQGSLEWDGMDQVQQVCKTGIYILDIEALDLNGKTIKSRLTSVLARNN